MALKAIPLLSMAGNEKLFSFIGLLFWWPQPVGNEKLNRICALACWRLSVANTLPSLATRW
jgi:hypothetical protein